LPDLKRVRRRKGLAHPFQKGRKGERGKDSPLLHQAKGGDRRGEGGEEGSESSELTKKGKKKSMHVAENKKRGIHTTPIAVSSRGKKSQAASNPKKKNPRQATKGIPS